LPGDFGLLVVVLASVPLIFSEPLALPVAALGEAELALPVDAAPAVP
jgi:hypothetical protein